MQLLQQTTRPQAMILLSVAAIFLFLLVAEWVAILLLNDGHFMFVLDDPYIHLALAENIWLGHYGVNAGEYAAPSSSILWPFMLAPFAAWVHADMVVLFLNAVLSWLSMAAVWRCPPLPGFPARLQLLALLLFMLATNLTGLVFIGMEHSLQVCLAVLVACGLVAKLEGKPASTLLLFAIIAAPLVRYENALVSAAALIFLLLQKEYWKSLVSGTVIVVLLAGFSLFLLGLGLSYLPDSVLAKSGIAASGLEKLLGNLRGNLALPNTPKAMAMLLMAAYLMAVSLGSSLAQPLRQIALLAGLVLLLHLSGGRIGWYFRYEMAVWAFALVLFGYVYARLVLQQGSPLLIRAGKWLVGVVTGVALLESLAVLVTTPLAASNVYHQQYQLHRFITEAYRQPVAVNDLGWTSYRNTNYVLDLWGLGSGRARELRLAGDGPKWMDRLADEKQVDLAMIYHNPAWFAAVPDNWVKVAELDIAGPKITAWYPVSFYVRHAHNATGLREQLKRFGRTLPQGSELHLEKTQP